MCSTRGYATRHMNRLCDQTDQVVLSLPVVQNGKRFFKTTKKLLDPFFTRSQVYARFVFFLYGATSATKGNSRAIRTDRRRIAFESIYTSGRLLNDTVIFACIVLTCKLYLFGQVRRVINTVTGVRWVFHTHPHDQCCAFERRSLFRMKIDKNP